VRRATLLGVRLMIVLLLTAAALHLPLPRRSGDRVRIHLIDRSQSVGLKGPTESLRPEDVDAIIAHDRDAKAPGDTVTWASFGKTMAWESKEVDPRGTDLSAALAEALGRQPTEIILYTDGRGDPGDALFRCRQKGVPVYVLPLGPTSIRDVRFRRLHAPASVRAGERCSIEVAVESTYDVSCTVGIGTDVRPVSLSAGVPFFLEFPRTGPGRFVATIDVADDCLDNNTASGEIFGDNDRPKILALSAGLEIPGLPLTVAPRLPEPIAFDAVILDNVLLTKEDQSRLADYVRNGGGLVILGGEKSYALGGWSRTPLEQMSPLKIHPDQKLAVVLGIDASGSMTAEYESAVEKLEEARSAFDDDDDVMGMTFTSVAKIMDVSALRKEHPSGGTSIIAGITAARLHLESRNAGRKVVVLMTDGETVEKPEDIRAAIAGLEARNIGLIVITTSKTVPGADNRPIKAWRELERSLKEVAADIQDLTRTAPDLLELRAHPMTAGVPRVPVSGINRTTAKSDAQVLATVGQTPRQDPVLALRPFGHGRVVAFTLKYTPVLARLFRQSVEYAVGDRAEGLTLSVDPPKVIAEGTYPDAEFTTDGVRVAMKQVGPHRWEGRLPADLSGTLVVRKGRARAAATIPCPPEFEALGVDRAALERIAQETGGRVLRLPSDLDRLPRPEQSTPRSGRPLFLVAALAFVFLELGVSIYWKV